jgi:hypothetical protein
VSHEQKSEKFECLFCKQRRLASQLFFYGALRGCSGMRIGVPDAEPSAGIAKGLIVSSETAL